MASNSDIIKENDTNMKRINEKVRGKLSLQRDILNFIHKHEQDEEERRKNQAAGAPALSRGEELIQKRSEAQMREKRKTQGDEDTCPLDADGAHQPVRIVTWMDGPGTLEDGEKHWDRRLCNLDKWGHKLFCQLFSYLEPSLFGGALQPTHVQC